MTDSSLRKKIDRKNIQDTLTLGIVMILIIFIIKFFQDQDIKVTMLASSITCILYLIGYQVSRAGLTKSIDRLVDNELREFQKISVKVLQLSEKQRQLTHNYTEMLDKVVQTAKLLKAGSEVAKEKTQNMSYRIQKTYDSSEQETKSLTDNIVVMQNLKNKVQVIAELIIELTEYIKQIGSTVNIVENISEQTNMLALNAAVEAARAGEYGKGFAVVAGEIRKLADESKQATNKITSLVAEIEQTTSSTIMAAEDSAKEIENGVKNASDISENVNVISSGIKNLGSDINEIIEATTQQQTLTNNVLESIDVMQKSISETIRTMEENIENIRAFSEISTNIKDNIGNQ